MKSRRRDWFFDGFFTDFDEEFKRIEEDIARIFEEAERLSHRVESMRPEPQAPSDDAPEPLLDVLESEDSVRVVCELPDVCGEDIGCSVSGDVLDVSVCGASYKRVFLPCPVRPIPQNMTFKNGVLDVSFSRDMG